MTGSEDLCPMCEGACHVPSLHPPDGKFYVMIIENWYDVDVDDDGVPTTTMMEKVNRVAAKGYEMFQFVEDATTRTTTFIMRWPLRWR